MSNEVYGSGKNPKDPEASRLTLERAYRGSINVSGLFFPDDGTTSTDLYHRNIGYNSFIALYPITALAAPEVVNIWEDRTLREAGKAVIVHPSYADGEDYQFMFIVIG